MKRKELMPKRPQHAFRRQKKRSRNFVVGSLHRSELSAPHNGSSVPFIRLSGTWLHELGFKQGTRFIVFASPGRIVAQVVQSPPRT